MAGIQKQARNKLFVYVGITALHAIVLAVFPIYRIIAVFASVFAFGTGFILALFLEIIGHPGTFNAFLIILSSFLTSVLLAALFESGPFLPIDS